MSLSPTKNNPDWSALCDLISIYRTKHWVINDDYFPVFEQFLSSELKPHSGAEAKLNQLKQGVSAMLSELRRNEAYLAQQLFPAPIGLMSFDKWVLPPDAGPYEGEATMMQYVLDTVTEQIRNANFQMELMAKQGYALRFETDVINDPSQTKMNYVRLTGQDFKGRTFEVGKVPVLGIIPMQASVDGAYTPFKGVLLDTSNAVVTLKGPIGDVALQILKGPLTGMIGKMHARKNITPTPLIDSMKSVMYAPNAAITSDDPLMKPGGLEAQIVIPLNTVHRSVQAQINKIQRDFATAMSSAVQRGKSLPEIRAGISQVAKFCRESKPDRQAAIDLAIQQLIPATDRSGAGYFKKYLQATLQRPVADKERDFWQQLLSGKEPVAQDVILATHSLMQSGAGLYMNLPKKDFKFSVLPLKKPFLQSAGSGPDRQKKSDGAQRPHSSPKTSRGNERDKPAAVRLPGQREQYFKAVESIIASMDGSVEQRVKAVVESISPGLHPHFVMHRIESMNHLIRSVQASQDPNFVKAGIYMMISCIEAQFRETGIVNAAVIPESADSPAFVQKAPEFDTAPISQMRRGYRS